jgi:hypothetical protein
VCAEDDCVFFGNLFPFSRAAVQACVFIDLCIGVCACLLVSECVCVPFVVRSYDKYHTSHDMGVRPCHTPPGNDGSSILIQVCCSMCCAYRFAVQCA